MKIFKFSFVFLLIAFIFNISSVLAGNTTSTGIVNINGVTVKPRETYTSTDWTKGNDLNPQSYIWEKAATTITAPCPKCKFRITLFQKSGNNYDEMGGITGKTGDNHYFDNRLNHNSSASGDYRITIKRADITAVNSTEFGDWYLAKANSNATYVN